MKCLFLICLSAITFAACGDKEEDPVPTPTPTITTQVQLKENGTALVLDYQAIWTYGASPSMYGLGITQNKTGAEAPQRKLISIRIQGSDFNVGSTHSIGTGNDNEIIYVANHSNSRGQYKANKNFPGSHGTFTLTKIKDLDGSKKAFFGTFNGTVVNMDGDSIVITEGKIIE